MKKIYLILISLMFILSTAGCSGAEQTIDSAEQANDSSGQSVSDVNNTTVSVSEKEMADAKEEVLSCVRDFAETKSTGQAGSSNDENSEEMENIINQC